METAWVVRAGRGSENIDDFVDKCVVALGDPEIGDVSSKSKEEITALYARLFPTEKERSISTWANQMARFTTEFATGDAVVTFDRDRRLYLLGTIESSYSWRPDLIAEFPHIRKVRWTREVARDDLNIETRNTLGAIQTIFRIGHEAWSELQAHAKPMNGDRSNKPPPSTEPTSHRRDVEEESEERRDLIAAAIVQADTFIEDAIDRLDPYEMQELIAGILRAMGYRTQVSAKGADRGVDIFASPDGLGLEEPRIFVEVKHREDKIGAPAIRAFLGGRKPGDRCLYVSTGGFRKDALYEADRAGVPLRLLTREDVRRLLVEYNEKLDPPTQALVPLRRIYWPA